MATKRITVQIDVGAPVEKVWQFFTEPKHIMKWNFASDDWECPKAQNDLRVGGKFSARMSAKDQSAGFDFGGTYTEVDRHRRIAYTMGDGRKVRVDFETTPYGTRVRETFDLEGQNSEEMQRKGWQAILENFKKHAESSS